MKLTAPRQSLLSAVQAVSPATAARSVNPVLTNLKLTATGEFLTLAATDLELGIRQSLHANITRAGSCLLPPDRLAAILRESQSETVDLSTDKKEITLKIDHAYFRFPLIDPDTFPDLPDVTASTPIPPHVVADGIRRVVNAADKRENARYTVHCVLFDPAAGTLVATDTKQLACYSFDSIPDVPPALLPLKTINLLSRLTLFEPRIAITPNSFTLIDGDTLIHSGLTSGKFPPYRDIFPKKHSHEACLPVSQFAAALRQASVMTDAESKRVDLEFDPNKLILTAQGPDVGESKIEMEGEWNFSLKIAFDPSFLLSYLRTLTDERVTLQLTDDMKPAVFVSSNHKYLIMPMGEN